ncbi:MAG TPA: hypothetical protein PK715_16250, partial [Chitinophagales bacterium]|nr:hypothetical protein [Chitinophagales bacterium]
VTDFFKTVALLSYCPSCSFGRLAVTLPFFRKTAIPKQALSYKTYAQQQNRWAYDRVGSFMGNYPAL